MVLRIRPPRCDALATSPLSRSEHRRPMSADEPKAARGPTASRPIVICRNSHVSAADPLAIGNSARGMGWLQAIARNQFDSGRSAHGCERQMDLGRRSLRANLRDGLAGLPGKCRLHGLDDTRPGFGRRLGCRARPFHLGGGSRQDDRFATIERWGEEIALAKCTTKSADQT